MAGKEHGKKHSAVKRPLTKFSFCLFNAFLKKPIVVVVGGKGTGALYSFIGSTL